MPPESFQESEKKKKHEGKKKSKFAKYDPLDQSVKEMQKMANNEANTNSASDSWAKAEMSVKALSDRIMNIDHESEAKELRKEKRQKKK